MNLSIQPATMQMVRSYWNALDAVARERKFLCFTEGPPYSGTEAFVQQVVDGGGTQFYAVDGDVDGGVVVGWCDVIRSEHDGFKHGGSLGMGVIASHRHQGVGRRLIRACIDDAVSKGVERIELEVFVSNKPAISLYRSMGFVEEGRKRGARSMDGVYDDLLVMAFFAGSLADETE